MPRTILIVDDIFTNRAILKKILGDEYDILEAEDGRAALACMRREGERISAVLLDLAMPVLDGYRVLEEMRDDPALAALPVIVTTGKTEEGSEARALSLGANDYITKPYNATITRQRIRNTIRLRETAATINALKRDPLTGLYNRESFFEKAASLIRTREPGYYTLSCFDIDSFKVINDQYGTVRGDSVLCHVGNAIRQCAEKLGGICCRVMADNFAILYPSRYMGSSEIAENHRLATAPPGLNRAISIRVGRYIVDDFNLSVGAMYDRAALAEHSIKGRYDVYIAQYDESLREALLREQRIVTEMNAALRGGQFEPWFQPQYDHATGALVGAEALARWRRPDGALVSPAEFIPVFERNGFIYELDKFIWERVCATLRRWLDEGREPLPVSVNISRYDLFREDFYATLTGLVENYRLPAAMLRLEVTESAFAKSTAQIVAVVKRLIAYGFTMEIDDFGSGYSSLNTLKDVPATILKLDMRFLETSEDSRRGGNILESIVRMAKWLDMTVIAEGVETKTQADYLKSIGCYYVQGYLYAKPMPLAQYQEFVAHQRAQREQVVLKTVETLDNNAFWDPSSMETLIFNSYVGGACILEYQLGRVELLRANTHYIRELGLTYAGGAPLNRLEPERYLDADNRRVLAETLGRAVEGDREEMCELRMTGLGAGRESAYIRLSARPLARSGDRFLLYCAVIDMTAQREAEQALRESNRLMETLMNDTPGGFCRVRILPDGSARLVYANDGFCALAEMSRAELDALYGTGLRRGVHPDDALALEENVREHARDNGQFHAQCRLRRGGGSYVPVLIAGRLTRAADGTLFLNAYSTDLSAQSTIDDKRRELIENLPCGAGIYEWTPAGIRATFINRRYRQYIGREVGDLRVAPVWEVVHADDRARLMEALKTTLRQGGEGVCDIRIMDGAGGYIPFRVAGCVGEKSPARTLIYVTYTPISQEKLTLKETLPYVLSAMMESTSDLSFAKDRDFRYLCCSRGFARMVGLKDETEIYGKTDFDLFPPEIAEKYRADDARLAEEGKSLVDMVELIPSDDGVAHYSSTSKYLLYDTAGTVIGLYGTGRDITEYRAAFERLRLVANSIPGGLATYEVASGRMRLLYFSDGYFLHTGYDKDEYARMAKDDPLALVFEEDMEVIRQAVAEVMAGAASFHYEYRCRRKGGGYRWLSMQGNVVERHGESAVANVLKFDITRRKLDEERLRMSEEQYRLAQKLSGAIMCRYDVADRSVNMSGETAALFGTGEKVADVPHAPVRLGMVDPQSASAYIGFYEEILSGGKTGEGEFRVRTAQGWRWLKGRYSTIFANDGAPVYAVVSFTDVTERRAMEEKERELQRQAALDGMTGVYNRGAAEALIRQRLKREAAGALLIVDLDNLKTINDTFGHPQGDKALSLIARALRERFGETGVVGRFGGDEFLVYVAGPVDRTALSAEMEALTRRVAAEKIGPRGEAVVYVSIGAAFCAAGAPFEEMYQQADKALYYAKRNGKRQFAFYVPEID